MKVFGDAVYFIALLSIRDRWHDRAIAINRQPPGPLVTTEWVLPKSETPSASRERDRNSSGF
jgi:hypothetical protein